MLLTRGRICAAHAVGGCKPAYHVRFIRRVIASAQELLAGIDQIEATNTVLACHGLRSRVQQLREGTSVRKRQTLRPVHLEDERGVRVASTIPAAGTNSLQVNSVSVMTVPASRGAVPYVNDAAHSNLTAAAGKGHDMELETKTISVPLELLTIYGLQG